MGRVWPIDVQKKGGVCIICLWGYGSSQPDSQFSSLEQCLLVLPKIAGPATRCFMGVHQPAELQLSVSCSALDRRWPWPWHLDNAPQQQGSQISQMIAKPQKFDQSKPNAGGRLDDGEQLRIPHSRYDDILP